MFPRLTSIITQYRSRTRPRSAFPPRDRLPDEHGFTLIEVLVAAIVLLVGVLAVLGTMIAATKATGTNKVRQVGTSLAREIVEDVRSLAYSRLVAANLPAELQPLVPGSTVNGSQLFVSRAGYTFSASFTACSLDDPSDGYGNHSAPPTSGGSWCPDVTGSSTTDTNPDDSKRVSVIVAPSGVRTTPAIQETALVYARPTHGPAVACLSTSASCPGINQTITSGTAQVFNVTTTNVAAAIQWLVNGNLPTSDQIPAGANDPYVPGSISSQFTWNFPAADGSYAIAATGFDQNGNPGTRSTVQITLNRHQVIAPTTLNAGWNAQLQGAQGGGVDVQWAPSIDQDVRYYIVYHNYNNTGASIVPNCDRVTGTTCTDLTAPSPNPPAVPTCTAAPLSYTKTNVYWVVGVDTFGGQPRESTFQSPRVDANLCDHPPSAPRALTGTVSGSNFHLSWSPPPVPDQDPGDSIQAWRIYRWPVSGTVQFPGSRLDLVGTFDASNNPVSSYDDHSPDPGGVTQSYCVTSVDTHLNESACSTVVSG